MAILTLMFGREVLGTYEMDHDVLIIGRASDCDVVIDNLNISRHHSQIQKREGLYYLEDLKSNNGTFLNGESISSEMLTFGDEIGIGKHTLRFDSHSRLSRAAGSLPAASPAHASGMDAADGGTVVVKAEQMAAFQAKMTAARRAHLRVSGLKGSPPVVKLTGGETRLGRSAVCEVRIPGLFVGRTHAIIGRRSSGYHIEHVGGVRALRINGAPSPGQNLRDGDIIQIGRACMTFHDEQTV